MGARIYGTGGASFSILDGRYLKLDASNDPLTGQLKIKYSQTNSILSDATGMLILDNLSSVGQNMIISSISGVAKCGWRFDYAGNINYHATGSQGHQFYSDLTNLNKIVSIKNGKMLINGNNSQVSNIHALQVNGSGDGGSMSQGSIAWYDASSGNLRGILGQDSSGQIPDFYLIGNSAVNEYLAEFGIGDTSWGHSDKRVGVMQLREGAFYSRTDGGDIGMTGYNWSFATTKTPGEINNTLIIMGNQEIYTPYRLHVGTNSFAQTAQLSVKGQEEAVLYTVGEVLNLNSTFGGMTEYSASDVTGFSGTSVTSQENTVTDPYISSSYVTTCSGTFINQDIYFTVYSYRTVGGVTFYSQYPAYTTLGDYSSSNFTCYINLSSACDIEGFIIQAYDSYSNNTYWTDVGLTYALAFGDSYFSGWNGGTFDAVPSSPFYYPVVYYDPYTSRDYTIWSYNDGSGTRCYSINGSSINVSDSSGSVWGSNLSWNDASASGYIIQVFDGFSYYYKDIGNITSFFDNGDMSSWTSGSFSPYPQSPQYTYYGSFINQLVGYNVWSYRTVNGTTFYSSLYGVNGNFNDTSGNNFSVNLFWDPGTNAEGYIVMCNPDDYNYYWTDVGNVTSFSIDGYFSGWNSGVFTPSTTSPFTGPLAYYDIARFYNDNGGTENSDTIIDSSGNLFHKNLAQFGSIDRISYLDSNWKTTFISDNSYGYTGRMKNISGSGKAMFKVENYNNSLSAMYGVDNDGTYDFAYIDMGNAFGSGVVKILSNGSLAPLKCNQLTVGTGSTIPGTEILAVGGPLALSTAMTYSISFMAQAYVSKADAPFYGSNIAAFGTNDASSPLSLILSNFVDMNDATPFFGFSSSEIGYRPNPLTMFSRGFRVVDLQYGSVGEIGIGQRKALNTLDVGGATEFGGALCVGTNYATYYAAPTDGAIIEGTVGIGTYTPNSKCDIYGSLATKTDIISTGTTLDNTHQIVIVSNNSTITLPSASSITGRQYNIIRSGTSNVLINTTSSQTISGDLTLTLTSQWDSVVVVSDGSNWVRCS